jgi:hypothetical protein
MGNKFASLVLVVSALAISACQKSSDSKPSPVAPLNKGFVGTWSWDFTAMESSSPGSYKNNLETIGDSGYMFYVIGADFNLTMDSQGFEDGNGNLNTERQTYTGNPLSSSGEKSAILGYSQETIDKARQSGASEEEIKKATANPCKLELKSETTATMTCKDSTTNLVKIDDKAADLLRSKVASEMKQTLLTKANLAKTLGGTTWTLLEVRSRNVDPDGKIAEYVQPESSINAEDSFKNDKGETTTTYNAKRISFSSDLSTAQINQNKSITVKVRPIKDGREASLKLGVRTSEHGYMELQQSGLVQLSKDKTTLSLMSDYNYSNGRYQKWSVYKRNN